YADHLDDLDFHRRVGDRAHVALAFAPVATSGGSAAHVMAGATRPECHRALDECPSTVGDQRRELSVGGLSGRAGNDPAPVATGPHRLCCRVRRRAAVFVPARTGRTRLADHRDLRPVSAAAVPDARASTDSPFVCPAFSAGWLTSKCHTTAHNPSVWGVM